MKKAATVHLVEPLGKASNTPPDEPPAFAHPARGYGGIYEGSGYPVAFISVSDADLEATAAHGWTPLAVGWLADYCEGHLQEPLTVVLTAENRVAFERNKWLILTLNALMELPNCSVLLVTDTELPTAAALFTSARQSDECIGVHLAMLAPFPRVNFFTLHSALGGAARPAASDLHSLRVPAHTSHARDAPPSGWTRTLR